MFHHIFLANVESIGYNDAIFNFATYKQVSGSRRNANNA